MIASAEEWAVLFHLFGAFLLVAGVTVAGVVFGVARRRRRPSEIALLLGVSLCCWSRSERLSCFRSAPAEQSCAG
jgi:hypothetical protein